MASKLVALLLLCLLGLVAGLSKLEHDPNGHTGDFHERDIMWTGQIEENGKIMSFWGPNLQAIESQIRQRNPSFTWSLEPETESETEASLATAADNDNDTSSSSSGNGNSDGVSCHVGANPAFASVYHIRQGINYLHKIHGNCTIGPGPGNCSRVSCSYQSGIWFCNDNPYPKSVPCSTFGDRAADIIYDCYAHGHFPIDSVQGQAFAPDGWNVIVAGAKC
ncbi:hypothetical protein F4777DRAFT_573886 [Nemania sp. FL0916]|nr:hypothetical protein F4777DRAFT_573886 [Nemania sp. FL0916]